MLYWKTFVAMCVSCWLFSLASAVVIILGMCGTIVFGTSIWVMVVLAFLMSLMTSVICCFMMDATLKERRSSK